MGHGADVALFRCRVCRFVTGVPQNPQPADGYYAGYHAAAAPPDPVARYEEWLRFAETQVGRGRLLEIGAGRGGFVRTALGRGWSAHATELSQTGLQALRALGATVFEGDVADAFYPDGHFDLVVSLEVLEHLPAPLEHLREVRRVTRPGGLLLLTTPNFGGLSRRMFGLRWRAVAGEHLGYFEPRTLAASLRDVGYARADVRSRTLDVSSWSAGRPSATFDEHASARIRDAVEGRATLRLAKGLVNTLSRPHRARGFAPSLGVYPGRWHGPGSSCALKPGWGAPGPVTQPGPRVRRAALAVTWGLATRLLLALFFVSMPGALDLTAPIPGFVGKVQSESLLYVRDVEEFIRRGSSPPDARMPGYAAALLPLRIVLSRASAANVLVLLQVLWAGLAVCALALLAIEVFGRRSPVPLLCLFAFGLSTYTTTWDVFLLPASLATSALVFGSLLQALALRMHSNGLLLAAGMLFAWAVFLIPTVFGAFFLNLVVVMVASTRTGSASYKSALRAGALFALPFVVAGGAWAYRNDASRGELSSLAAPATAPTALEQALEDFLRAWGGSVVHWDPRAEINWFELRAPQHFRLPAPPSAPPFPAYIYTTAFGPADLKAVRELIRDSLDQRRPPEAREQSGEEARARLERYRASVRAEKRFVCSVVAPLHLLGRFLLHSGTYNLFSRPSSELSRPELVFKISMTLLYWWVLLLGAVGIVFALVRKSHNPVLTGLAATALYLTVVYPVWFRHDEARHFVPAYPFVLLFACDGTARLVGALRSCRPWNRPPLRGADASAARAPR